MPLNTYTEASCEGSIKKTKNVGKRDKKVTLFPARVILHVNIVLKPWILSVNNIVQRPTLRVSQLIY